MFSFMTKLPLFLQAHMHVLCHLLMSLLLTLKTIVTYLSMFALAIQHLDIHQYLSRLMGKPTIYIGENKDADQLRGNREADQRLCFRYMDSTFSLLLKSEISSF